MEEEIDNNAVIDLTDEFAPGAPVRHESEEPFLQINEELGVEGNIAAESNTTEIAENGEGTEDNENNEAVAAGAEGNEGDAEALVEEDNPFGDDEDSDEEGGGVQVTIRKLEPTEKPAARQGKLDLDLTATINDKPIYDLDLAQMEDRPWRKPGADITDYFNYGFTEETWNLYCERQKKLRAEFNGNQQAVNNALFSAIKISNPLANPIINPSSSVVKVLTDNGGRFKQPVHHIPTQSPIQNEQIIRTVISGAPQPAPMDFTRPPPGMSMPPPMGIQPPMSSVPPSITEAPPGIDSISDLPPGVETTSVPSAPPAFGGGLDLNLGLPPLGFNPNMPPPGMNMPPLGMLSTSLPPPGFSMPPPQFQHSRAGFGPGPVTGQPPRPMIPSSSFGNVSDDDDERRSSRRKRSRSRSPRRERDDRRDRDSRRRGERDTDRTSSRRHRSRSTSGDRRRRRDDRERGKRRERREEDDDRKKRSRRDEEEDSSSGRRERKERSSKSRPLEDEDPSGTGGTGNDEPSAE
uniref:Pre-mRNA 3'-end-processing factor FIP1 n=1 Tax=Caenorhabditis tropicalis TaxID=1561998 RepID=A0A1I7T621_9PELO